MLGSNLGSLAKLSPCSVICKHLGCHSHVHVNDVLWGKHCIWGQKPYVFIPSHCFTFYVALHYHLTSGNLHRIIWRCGWKGPPTLVVWHKLKIGVERLWKSRGAMEPCKVGWVEMRRFRGACVAGDWANTARGVWLCFLLISISHFTGEASLFHK